MILSEELDNLPEAEKLFLKNRDLLKEKSSIYLVTDELGRQNQYKGKFNRAKKYLKSIVDYEVGEYVVSKADTYLSLARLTFHNDKIEAHSYMENGLLFVKNNKFVDEITNIQFIGEFATSLFLTGEIKDSLLSYIEGYELILDSFEENPIYINTQIRYGNAIGYLVHLLDKGYPPKESFTEPYLGFISNNNDLTDLYLEEKLILNIFSIIEFFEIIDDRVRAEYWCYKMFSEKEKYGINIFHRMLASFFGYLIVDDQLDYTFEQQLDIINQNEKLLATDPEQISNKIEKELISSIQKHEAQKTSNSDLEMVTLVLTPILIHLLAKCLKKEISKDELVNTLKGLIAKYSESFKTDGLVVQLNYILEHFPSNEKEADELAEYLKKVNPKIFEYVFVLTYLICSVQLNSKKSIELHFITSNAFGLYRGSINNLILIPFLIEFWNQKILQEPEKFDNARKLRENLQKIPKLKLALQCKAIFALVAEQLHFGLSDDNRLWLKEYTDEYGE